MKEYWEQVKAEDEKRRSNIKYVDIPHIPEIVEPSVQISKNLDMCSDDILESFVKTNWKLIIDKASKNEESYLKAFISRRFVDTLTKQLSIKSIEKVNDFIPSINYIVYNTIMRNKDDEKLKSSLVLLAKTVNRVIISTLCNQVRFLTENVANEMIVNRYSSGYEDTISSVHNLNKSIYSKLNKECTIEDIQWIYHILYKHLLELFEGFMHDQVWSNELATPEQTEICYNCNLAILDYLEQQVPELIYTVLKHYSGDHFYLYQNVPVRFSMLTCNREDYPRIWRAIYALQNEGYIIP
jgi:hypothetical protein